METTIMGLFRVKGSGLGLRVLRNTYTTNPMHPFSDAVTMYRHV